ncbi:hypothetical protein [Schaalia vaccimaxillae]|uniref:hypothetical protein n=1 Tax=Schaalia vaccimaxillae TaxID=183916 RepID=UPI0003B4B48B|nr:hypothetical protein [Schaalia vaccimaxillae]
MSPQSPPTSPPSFVTEFGLHGAHKRAPDGRKLTVQERECLPLLDDINEGVREATNAVAQVARTADTAWVVGQFLDPMLLCRRKKVALPDREILLAAIARIEDVAEGVGPSSADARREPRKKLTVALDAWTAAFEDRAQDLRWKQVEGRPVTLAGYRKWRESMAAFDLQVIPSMPMPNQFAQALERVMEWDEILDHRGHSGEQFSLREEVVRLNNWPGDQWFEGDDYALAQKRFHRRLKKSRKLADDPIRDRIMERALFLREGLLLDPVDPLEWFLAVCRFRWEAPAALDVRPELLSWKFVDWMRRLGEVPRHNALVNVPRSIRYARSPVQVPDQLLRAVTGPDVMIDLDEDVVTALPPGCRVRRLIVSADGPLGPDWTVYWVESEWEDSRPILDLVESEKLHPQVIFVSDEEPEELAEKIRPFLHVAFEIPTNKLTAHSHIPGVWPAFPAERLDAGL